MITALYNYNHCITSVYNLVPITGGDAVDVVVTVVAGSHVVAPQLSQAHVLWRILQLQSLHDMVHSIVMVHLSLIHI